MWTRIGKFWGLFSFIIILLSSIVLAQDTSFEATVNTNKISLKDVLELTLTVHGAKGDLSTVPMPVVDGFETRYVGPMTRLSIINGATTNEHSFVYNLFPSKEGHFNIPPISLTIDGQTYVTSPIDIDVVNKGLQTTDGKTTETEGESIEDKVFMKTFLDSKEVYVGQKTPLVMKVYVKDLSLQLASAPYMTPDGYTADATASMEKIKEIVDGVEFDALKFDANIYPTRQGDIKVGPFQATGELVYRVKQSNDFFGDLFANQETRPITLHAPAMTIHVLPLPDAGRPQDFSGAVGQYDFKASVGPSSVKVGDPLTLHMTITGEGRLKGLAMPVINDSRFKTYDPQIKEEGGSKILEQIIIPASADIKQVPSISFNYFDPINKEYKTITQGPFPIKVQPSSAGQEFKAYGFVDKTKMTSDKPFVVQLSCLKTWAKQFLVKSKVVVKNGMFWCSIVMIGLVWLGYRLWQSFNRRLETDVAFARRFKADSKARGLLKVTKSYLQKNNSKEFYKSVHKTLNDYLADKMHVPLAGLNWDMIATHLKERSIDPSKLQAIKTLFERGDLVRFASVDIPKEQMLKDFEQLQDLISYLPKILK